MGFYLLEYVFKLTKINASPLALDTLKNTIKRLIIVLEKMI